MYFVNILNILNGNMVFLTFFTGNQKDNCPIEFIFKG